MKMYPAEDPLASTAGHRSSKQFIDKTKLVIESLLKSNSGRIKLIEKSRSKSEVWKTFKIVEVDNAIKDFVVCGDCGAVLSWNSEKTGTNSLRCHIAAHARDLKLQPEEDDVTKSDMLICSQNVNAEAFSKSEWDPTVNLQLDTNVHDSIDIDDQSNSEGSAGLISNRKRNRLSNFRSYSDQWDNDVEATKKPEDEFQIFGNYIASLVRNMPNITEARRLQRRITSFALQCIEESDTQP